MVILEGMHNAALQRITVCHCAGTQGQIVAVTIARAHSVNDILIILCCSTDACRNLPESGPMLCTTLVVAGISLPLSRLTTCLTTKDPADSVMSIQL